MIFKITENNQDPEKLYQRVKGWWRMAKERANIDKTKYVYAYSTPERKFEACYKVEEWKSKEENGKIRYGFKGKEENNDPMIGKPVESIAHVRGQVVFYPK